MWFIWIILGGVILFSGVISLSLVLSLRGRVDRLERQLQNSALQTTPVTEVPQTMTPVASAPIATIPQLTPEPMASNQFSNWLKEDWLLKLGALLLLIGFGWLTTYAFLNNWIGPMGRIAVGIIAGALFLILGSWRIRKYINQGGVFLVLGSTTILLTIFAAREIYNFFDPLSALVVMFLSTAFVAVVSLKYNSRALTLASLILAGIAPLLTNSPTTDYISLFSYLLVVVLGTIWVVAITGQRVLNLAALILVTFYSLPHFFSFTSSSADTGTLLLFAYAFSALFFITNTAGILKLKDQNITHDLVTAMGNGLFLLIWIMSAAAPEWQSLIISAWMLVFIIGSFLLFRATNRREPFYVYAGVGIAMLATATSVELSGSALVIAYTLESALISLISYAITRDVRIAVRLSLLFIGPILLSLSSMTSSAWASQVLQKDFFVLFILALTLLGLGSVFSRPARLSLDEGTRQLNGYILVGGSIYSYILLWLSLHTALPNDNTAILISLLVYTVIGLICYFRGLATEQKGLRIYGGVVIGFVVGRLLLVDVWRMEIAVRIIMFFLVGALLVSTAFLGRKKHEV